MYIRIAYEDDSGAGIHYMNLSVPGKLVDISTPERTPLIEATVPELLAELQRRFNREKGDKEQGGDL